MPELLLNAGVIHHRVLLIEKNSVLGGEIEKGLNVKGFMADVTESLEDGEYLMDIRNYDLVMVSDKNALSFVSRIKEKHSFYCCFSFFG